LSSEYLASDIPISPGLLQNVVHHPLPAEEWREDLVMDPLVAAGPAQATGEGHGQCCGHPQLLAKLPLASS